MREPYFTPETIARKAEAFKQGVDALLRSGMKGYDPCQSALLILDMQRFFLEPASHAFVPSARAIVPGLGRLIQAYTVQRLPVVFTRHLNTPENAGSMSAWWRDLITIENPLSRIAPGFDVGAGTVVIKSQYDAFHETNLEEILRDRDVSQVVVCGVMAHLCCETTARSAFMRGFEVFFAIDGTATYNESFHRAALLNLAHGFARPVLVSELLIHLGVAGEG